MGTLNDWSTTAASNATADATINWAEGQLAPTLNNSARGMMARIAAWVDQLGGLATTGASNAYVYTSPTGHAFSALVTNSRITFKANHTNTGAATLAVDGLTATAIRKTNGATALAAGDIVSGQIYDVVYDGTFWVLLGLGASGFQPIDADLTAIAALGYTSGEYIIKKTAADTWALIAITAAGAALLDDADAAAQRTTLGSTTVGDALFIAADAAAGRAALSLGTVATQAANAIALTGGTITGLTSLGYNSNTTAGFRMQANGASFYFPFSFENNSINGSGQGFAIYYRLGQSGSPVDAAYHYIISTDNWSAAGNRSADLVWFTAQGGTLTERLRLSGGASGSYFTGNLAVVSGAITARIALSSETSGTLTSASANRQIRAAGGVTIPASVFTADDIILIRGMGTARTITRGSGLTMYVNGSDVATATLTARGTMSVVFDSATVCTLHGDVS